MIFLISLLRFSESDFNMAETGFHKLQFDAQLKLAVAQIYGLFEMTFGHFYMFCVSAAFDANLAERTDSGNCR